MKKKVKFTRQGDEIPDPTPSELKVGFGLPKSWTTSITDIVKNAMSDQAVSQGYESWEEANDFNCKEEDEDLEKTPYEEHFDHEENFVNDVFENAKKKLSDRDNNGKQERNRVSKESDRKVTERKKAVANATEQRPKADEERKLRILRDSENSLNGKLISEEFEEVEAE